MGPCEGLSIKKHILSEQQYMPHTIVGARDIMVNETDDIYI